MKIMKKISIFLCAICSVFGFSGCSDFFNQESDYVIYADNQKLDNAVDTVYSVMGILSKLQKVADRTVLLGELRGDLVDVTNIATSDLRDVASFNIGEDNVYNSPRDYYAIINNCNFFIERVDTALKDNRNNYIFMKEYAAVKAIRAWTYLQLAINYGSVYFVTEPILTELDSRVDKYPKYGIQDVCEYFINDLQPLAEKYGRLFPGYGTVRGNQSILFFFPINVVLGDLYLWAASASGNVEQYKQAALAYYRFIRNRNSENLAYPTGTDRSYWDVGTSSWDYPNGNWVQRVTSEDYINVNDNAGISNTTELITMIPCDSIPAEGNYSELVNLFNSREDNNYKVSIVPSKRIFELSLAQDYCNISNNGSTVYYGPKNLTENRSGDLRLSEAYYTNTSFDRSTGERVDMQTIYKYRSNGREMRNVHIYRRQMVFLRMAEALNMAGYPRMAFQILSRGLNNTVLEEEVYPYYSQSDSVWVSQFDFPSSRYVLMGADEWMGFGVRNYNTMGIHSRGSGFTPYNEYYQLPIPEPEEGEEYTYEIVPDDNALTLNLQNYVNELILNEGALEFAFEGVRYYDLLRFALRSSDPNFLSSRIALRHGEENAAEMNAISSKLADRANWYMRMP